MLLDDLKVFQLSLLTPSEWDGVRLPASLESAWCLRFARLCAYGVRVARELGGCDRETPCGVFPVSDLRRSESKLRSTELGPTAHSETYAKPLSRFRTNGPQGLTCYRQLLNLRWLVRRRVFRTHQRNATTG